MKGCLLRGQVTYIIKYQYRACASETPNGKSYKIPDSNENYAMLVSLIEVENQVEREKSTSRIRLNCRKRTLEQAMGIGAPNILGNEKAAGRP